MNAIIHRNYQSSTDIQIKIFDNSINFFNPSGLYGDITVEDLKTDTYRASTRNKLLAEAFYLTKDIEKYGSGFTRIRKEIEDYPTMEFRYENRSYGFFTELSYRKQRITTDLKKDVVKDVAKDVVKDVVKERETFILQMIRKDKVISAQKMSELLNVTLRTIQRDLNKLQEEGILQRIGGRKSGYWKIVKRENK